MINKTSDKNVANDIEFLKSNEADALYFRGNPKLKSAMQNILAEREQDKKRIQELEEQVKTLDEAYTGTIQESKKWFDVAHKSIPKQVVIDLKNSITLDNTIVGGRRNGKTLEYGIKLGKIKACEELLEGEK